ncbi:hypothetical protein HanHA300_Chr10g0368271 [Helianthus annuus]|nr:hypothetical protein HanHA300_Chr10g0368271 [Helianthus annuus]KAJ0530461.1 hypothetical protein HanHA89_Chr10g0390161 [Helianthus annuus]KAJ0697314.1 hypothetical protein HanLR1_Chr10g0367611 [Helianthus annuus]
MEMPQDEDVVRLKTPQSSIRVRTSQMILMATSTTTSTRFWGNPMMGNNHFCGSVLGDSVSGLKDDAGLAVEWSVDEQRKLEEGLSKFADEPSIMRYIKIATTMRDKTVRDVALRCKWMADNLVESSSKQSISSVPTLNVAPFPVTMSNRTQIDGMTFEGNYLNCYMIK